MATWRPLLETRAAAEVHAAGPGRVAGYASIYGVLSADLGGFREKVEPGAFDSSLASPGNIMAFYGHEPRSVLGRVGAGTLRLASDNRGLAFEVDLPETSVGRDLAVLVGRGDVAGASFAFRVLPDGEAWDFSTLPARRTLRAVELSEISICSQPAYPQTSAALRDLRARDPWLVAARAYVGGLK